LCRAGGLCRSLQPRKQTGNGFRRLRLLYRHGNLCRPLQPRKQNRRQFRITCRRFRHHRPELLIRNFSFLAELQKTVCEILGLLF
jgi:hypothetical protein